MKVIYMQRTISIISKEKWLSIKGTGVVKMHNNEAYLVIEKDVQL